MTKSASTAVKTDSVESAAIVEVILDPEDIEDIMDIEDIEVLLVQLVRLDLLVQQEP